MKSLLIFCWLLIPMAAAGHTGVQGRVLSLPDCASKVMVWLSLDKEDYKERMLLLHTEVPVGGTFQFYLLPGSYQLRASDSQGCDYLQKISVKEKVEVVQVQMVKK